jgi:hypothetical protein
MSLAETSATGGGVLEGRWSGSDGRKDIGMNSRMSAGSGSTPESHEAVMSKGRVAAT